MWFRQTPRVFVKIIWNLISWPAERGVSGRWAIKAFSWSLLSAPCCCWLQIPPCLASCWCQQRKRMGYSCQVKCRQRVGLLCGLQTCAESVCKLQLAVACRLPCQQHKYSVTKCVEPGYWILLVPRKLCFTSEGIHQVTGKLLSL